MLSLFCGLFIGFAVIGWLNGLSFDLGIDADVINMWATILGTIFGCLFGGILIGKMY